MKNISTFFTLFVCICTLANSALAEQNYSVGFQLIEAQTKSGFRVVSGIRVLTGNLRENWDRFARSGRGEANQLLENVRLFCSRMALWAVSVTIGILLKHWQDMDI